MLDFRHMKTAFDLQKLLRDVFQPGPDEIVLVMTDVPSETDNPDWQDRRLMADEWRDAFGKMGLETLPLLTYASTGAGNADLPSEGRLDSLPVKMADVLGSCTIAVAMTEYSATAPLAAFVKKYAGRLRVASMPGVLRRMENTALAADYRQVAVKVNQLTERLTRAEGADVEFSTGHKMHFDLRWRSGHGDDGMCGPDKPFPLINLPSGEAYIVPYEGERAGEPSQTAGDIPVSTNSGMAVLNIKANRIESIEGGDDSFRQFLFTDPARRNIAELGLGCNDKAVVTGNVLEDEKAGFHWAYGRSEHLGGVTGPKNFLSPKNVVHRDIVYAAGCSVTIARLTMRYHADAEEVIMRDGRYTIFGE